MTEREALKQSEQHQDWCAFLTQMLASMPPKPAPCNCKPPQPEQDPVALETVYETIIKWDEVGGKRSRRELARRIASLYTTPPQSEPVIDKSAAVRIASSLGWEPKRKPLTVEQIAKELYKFEAAGAWYQFARAIEATHGIKE